MSYGNPDFSSLTPYVQENTDLVHAAILNTDELAHVSIRTGVSAGTTSINVFNADFTDAERACAGAWGTSGVSFDQIAVAVSDRAIKQNLCSLDARNYWLAERMSPSAYGAEEMPFAETIANYMLAGVKKNISDFIGSEIATQVWPSVTPGDGGASVPAGAAVLTVSNALEQLNDLYDATADAVKMMDDVKIFMSPANYRIAVRAIVAQGGAGFFHYNLGDGQGVVTLPGTNVTLVPSSGFAGLDTIVCAPAKYVIACFGLQSDEDRLNLTYDASEDLIKMSAYYRRGLGVYAVDQCSTNGL
jgi:hypothetical protein